MMGAWEQRTTDNVDMCKRGDFKMTIKCVTLLGCVFLFRSG